MQDSAPRFDKAIRFEVATLTGDPNDAGQAGGTDYGRGDRHRSSHSRSVGAAGYDVVINYSRSENAAHETAALAQAKGAKTCVVSMRRER